MFFARHDQDGQIGLSRTNPAKNVQTVLALEIQVEQDKIVRLVDGQPLSFRLAGNDLNREMFLLQPLMEKIRQRRVIFREKNAHRLTRTNWIWKGLTTVCL